MHHPEIGTEGIKQYVTGRMVLPNYNENRRVQFLYHHSDSQIADFVVTASYAASSVHDAGFR